MQETITIALPAGMKPMLDEIGEREGISPAELAARAIEEYLFVRQFRLLQERMIPRAQGQGIRTEDDVFERIS
jgi:predicted transcriptional regulator